MKIGAYETHPIVDLFPLLEGEDFKSLAADIKANGANESVWLLRRTPRLADARKPLILDGRNVYRACIATKTKPRFRDYTGTDPIGFILSRNLHRRQLSDSHRAIIAAKLLDLARGGDRKSKGRPARMTAARAAAAANFGERTVKRPP